MFMAMALFGSSFHNLLAPPHHHYDDDATPFLDFEHIIVTVYGMMLGEFDSGWFSDASRSVLVTRVSVVMFFLYM